MSASCSIEPDSLKSLKIGLLSSRLSTLRDNCAKAIIGIFNSIAKVFNEREISEISN